MRAIITTFALTMFAGAAAAASDQDIYAGFAKNPDLSHDTTHMQPPGMVQGGMSHSNSGQSSGTSRAFIYRGFEEGNPDL